MLIQCAADFHGRKEKYKKFIEKAQELEPDMIILAGDLGHIEASIFKELPYKIFAVYGNMDGDLSHLKDVIVFIDGRKIEYKGINILGVGASYPEDVGGDVDIIVSHVPPYKTKDKAFFGMRIGSKWLRSLVEEKQPKYVICGHVHEDAGYMKLGNSYIVNCSLGKKGEAVVIEFDTEEIDFIGF